MDIAFQYTLGISTYVDSRYHKLFMTPSTRRSRPIVHKAGSLSRFSLRGNSIGLSSSHSAADSPPLPLIKPFSNPIGVHALVFAGSWDEKACRSAFAGAARHGYDILEIPMLSPFDFDSDMTKKVLKEFPMIQPTVTMGLDFESDISSEDIEKCNRGEKMLLKVLENAHKIGSKYIGGVIYSAMAKYSLPKTEKGEENCIKVLKKLAQEAKKMGITVGLEAVNRYESNIINTAEDAMRIIRLIGEDNVVVHLDVYHMNIEENDFMKAIKSCGDRLGYVHIGESHRGYLGTGNVNFCEFFRALAMVQYQGPLTFESFSSRVVDPKLSYALAVWRNLWEDNQDLAQRSRCFIIENYASALRSQT